MAKVVVWLPVYKSDPHLEEALASIYAQTFKDFEVRVSVNSGTEETFSLLRRFSELGGLTLQTTEGDIAGIPHMKIAWDRLDQGDHKYSILIGAHDRWAPQHLDVLVKRMDSENAVRPISLVYSDTFQIDEAGALIGRYQDIMQTGQIGPAMIPQFVIAGVNSPQFYGMWNEAIRRKLPIRHACGGFDHLIVAEAALHGAILFEGQTQLFMRAPLPGATLENYGQRHLAPEILKAGPQDFLNQLEWCIHMVDTALEAIPAPARPLYKALLTASMFGTYMSLRGLNLNCVPGAMQAFNRRPEVQAMFSAANHISENVRMITRSNIDSANDYSGPKLSEST